MKGIPAEKVCAVLDPTQNVAPILPPCTTWQFFVKSAPPTTSKRFYAGELYARKSFVFRESWKTGFIYKNYKYYKQKNICFDERVGYVDPWHKNVWTTLSGGRFFPQLRLITVHISFFILEGFDLTTHSSSLLGGADTTMYIDHTAKALSTFYLKKQCYDHFQKRSTYGFIPYIFPDIAKVFTKS
jgi:hypothetical protein